MRAKNKGAQRLSAAYVLLGVIGPDINGMMLINGILPKSLLSQQSIRPKYPNPRTGTSSAANHWTTPASHTGICRTIRQLARTARTIKPYHLKAGRNSDEIFP